MQRKAIIFLLACLHCDICLSQQYPFIHYTPKDGLVNNRARLMYQDRHGLLYISTFGGLSVYDGVRFTNYTSTEQGMPINIVNDIVELGDDSLWIVPNQAKLYCLVRGRIKDVATSDGFYPVINKIIRCSNGQYYALADEGLFHFEDNRFNKIDLVDEKGSIPGRFFIDAIESKNKLFLITDFNILPVAGPGRIFVYDFKNNKVSVSDPLLAHSIILSPQGELLVSTDGGIKKIDEAALPENNVLLVPLPSIYKAAEHFVTNYMCFDRQQNLWLSAGQAVAKMDQQGRVKLFSMANGFSLNACFSIFQDKENTMWFADGQTGICKLVNPQFEYFPLINPGFVASDVYTDPGTDSVWFLDAGHKKILLRYQDVSKEFQLHLSPLSLPYRSIASSGNKIYVTDLYNVYLCNFSSKKEVRLSLIHDEPVHTPSKAIRFIMPDRHDNLIFIAEGISVLHPNKKLQSYPLGYFSDNFTITDDNQLWVATRTQQIFEFSLHPEDPAHYWQVHNMFNRELPPEMSPRSITADKKGNVWLGSRDHGLYCLFLKGKSLASWKQITTKDGLSDNFITYLHTDEENNIWVCSPGGLDRIQLKNGEFYIENVTSGNNIYQYLMKIQTSKGNIQWALTGAGVIRIAPAEPLQIGYQPKIILREITEGRNRIEARSGQFDLAFSHNNLSVAMAVPSFIDEKQIRFSYLLEGSGNKSWSDPSSQAIIHLVHLSPGVYTFKGRANFLNRRYPDTETSFSFIVSPPWWQTWWFRTLLLFSASGILLYSIRSYYHGKLKKQQFEFEKTEAIKQERTRIATDMHDDLGAGLARIRFLSESIKRKKPGDQSFLPEIGKISSFSDEMIGKMGEIVWALNEKNDSIADLIAFTRSYSVDYLQNHGIDYQVEAPAEMPVLFLNGETRRTIFLAVKESLFNIVKHAQASLVIIRFKMSETLDIDIQDNGKGIDWERIRPYANGISNIRTRIQSIKGNVEFINENGTTVRLNIPIDHHD